mmetsp:Transcript_6893/g.16426  ORF Transcript_6893/g.16426 Transcript_6893/m.16426 type:complete len:429 (-) Transcript_6893:195-1481(-)
MMNRMIMITMAVLLLAAPSLASSGQGWGPYPGNQASGYVPVNDPQGNDGNIFYWFFEAENNSANAPLILWLTGGPGCSSELAVFYEMGPYRINKQGQVSLNEYAWTKDANMIFVDQPIGTGFSTAKNQGDYVTNEKEVAADMWAFITQWMQMYPQFQNNELFVFGESYAGHYVPAISWKISQENKVSPTVNFKGFAIGNGLVWPAQQYLEYAPFSYKNGLIDQSTFQQLNQSSYQCQQEIESGSPFASYTCQSIVQDIVGNPPRFNLYDIKKPCNGPLCYDFSPLENLMQQQSVLSSLGVSSNSQWTECNMNVHSALMNDWFTNLEANIPTMLAEGLQVLVYSGELDFICNWFGGRRWVEEMQWAGQAQYNDMQFQDWHTTQGVAGTFKSVQNFTFLGVAEAGHMVPMDQPQNAYEMMMTFVKGGHFA